jgi:hypothetical protein
MNTDSVHRSHTDNHGVTRVLKSNFFAGRHHIYIKYTKEFINERRSCLPAFL